MVKAQNLTKSDTLYFNTDSYTLNAEQKRLLKMKVNWIKHEVSEIIITGHTDDVGDDAYNQRLSERRANAIVDFFKYYEIKSDKLKINAKGEKQPIADNTNDEGKAKNRRVIVEYHYIPTPIEEEKKQIDKRVEKYHEVIGRVYDETTDELLKAFVVVKKDGKIIVSFDNKEFYKLRTDIGQEYELHVTDEGYETKIVTLKVTDTTKTINTKIKPLKYSKKLTFENINFVGNEATFLPESYPELKELLKTMQDNPETKIEIHGHVNGPFTSINPMPEYISPTSVPWYYELSLARAKAVFSYLVDNGINPNRMTYKGLGNSQMLYPYAVSLKEQKLNRRVEVYILEE